MPLLAHLPALRRLEVTRCRASRAGLEALAAALPRVAHLELRLHEGVAGWGGWVELGWHAVGWRSLARVGDWEEQRSTTFGCQGRDCFRPTVLAVLWA